MASKAKQALDRLLGRSGSKRKLALAPIFLRKSGGWRKGQFKVWTPPVIPFDGEAGWGVYADYVPPDRIVTIEIYPLDKWNLYPTKSKAQAEARKVAASLRKAIGVELRMMFGKACRKCVGHEPPFRSQAQLKRVANAMVILKG